MESQSPVGKCELMLNVTMLKNGEVENIAPVPASKVHEHTPTEWCGRKHRVVEGGSVRSVATRIFEQRGAIGHVGERMSSVCVQGVGV